MKPQPHQSTELFAEDVFSHHCLSEVSWVLDARKLYVYALWLVTISVKCMQSSWSYNTGLV